MHSRRAPRDCRAWSRGALGVVALVGALVLSGCSRKALPAGAAPMRAAAGVPAPLGAGSAAYFLDRGMLEERYQAAATAAEHFARAVTLAETPAQALPAHLGLARVREAQGDRRGAIAALERALDVHASLRRQAAAHQPGPGAFEATAGADDVMQRLGRLYAAAGDHVKTEQLYLKALAEAKVPYRREEVLRHLVEALRRAGTLATRIQQKEKELEAKSPDEGTLWFLAVAYGAGAGLEGPNTDGAGQAVAVYRRLHELHPQDQQIRQVLLSQYERAGRVDEAVALLRTSAPTAMSPGAGAGAGPGDVQALCPGGLMPWPSGPALARAEEVVRLLMRTGRTDAARAETAKLVALGPREGARSPVAASRLYVEQRRPELASQALGVAAKAARSQEERRQVAIARAELLVRGARPAELAQLYDGWKKSEDPCLRAEGARRSGDMARRAVSSKPMAADAARRVP